MIHDLARATLAWAATARVLAHVSVPTLRVLTFGAAFLLASCSMSLAQTQIQGTNLLEAQAGNVPFLNPPNRTSLYDALDLDVRTSWGRIGGRFETDRSSDNTLAYATFTRRFVEWSDNHLRARVGTVYTLLGRGMIHRSFELPGVILNEQSTLSRYGPSRDVDGALVEASLGPWSTRLLAGTANTGLSSPGTGSVRYAGELAGGQTSLDFHGSGTVGAAYLRSTSTGAQQQELGSGFAGIDPLDAFAIHAVSLPLYFEYAQLGRKASQWTSFSTATRDTHALYASANLIWNTVSFSAEWKDYQHFRLGTNDPPSLVREQSAHLLNRGTHVLNADDERGFQLEGAWAAPLGLTATANLTRADTKRSITPKRFEERFFELRMRPARATIEGALFYDRGRDEFVGLRARRVMGGSATWRVTPRWSTSLDVQQQRAMRGKTTFVDRYLSAEAARAEWGSVAMIWEHTNDPLEEDPAKFGGAVDPRDFVAATVHARVSEKHEATLFYGERRGGLACTAGTCYQVLAFKGAELRLTTRF